MRTKIESNLIAEDKKRLSQFILDLCGFTLDKAGCNPTAYAFHLHIALRRQMVLKADKWNKLCQALPLAWHDEASAGTLILLKEFAQSIVDEVQQANRDPWGVKLLKTGYLSELDKARKNTETAIRTLANAPEDMSVSYIQGEQFAETLSREYLDALHAHRNYLDTLLTLPFVLEKFCVGVANNKGINYVPRKSAEMLTRVLDVVSLSLDEHQLTQALKLAVQIALPELPIDEQLIDQIKDELLPFIVQVMQNNERLVKAKGKIFPVDDPKKTAARQKLLSHLGIHFDSLQDVIQNTLLNPVHQCEQLASGLWGAAEATGKAIANDNVIDRAAQIGKIFANLEQMADVTAQVDESLLPSWLRETSRYYQELHQKADGIQNLMQAAYEGFGVFYNRLTYFIPESVRQYLTNRQDDFAEIFRTFGAKAGGAEAVLVYLTFYELAVRSDIQEPLIERFFNAYIRDLYKDTQTKFPYSEFKAFRKSLHESDLAIPLHQRLKDFADQKSDKPTPTLLGSEDFRAFDVVLMVHQLKELQIQFNAALQANDIKALSETLAALKLAMDAINSSKDNPTLKAYSQRFLKPAIEAMLLDAMGNEFIPLLERVIGYDKPRVDPINKADTNHLPSIYAKLKSRQRLSTKDYESLKSVFAATAEFTACQDLFTAASSLEKSFCKSFPASEAIPEPCPTPHQSRVRFITAQAFPNIKITLQYLLQGLDAQKQECNRLLDLCDAGSDLHALCLKKIEYIDSVKASINQLNDEITNHPDTLAQSLDGWLSGQKVEDGIKHLSFTSLSGKLVRFAWTVWPANEPKPDDNFLHNLLTYYFKDSDASEIYQAQKTFSDELNARPIPELMPLLTDPLSVDHLIPAKEAQMDQLLNTLLGINEQSFLAWGSQFLKTSVQKIVSSINRDTLMSLFPYPFMGIIAYQMMQSEEMRELLGQFLAVMATEYGDVIADKTLQVANVAKERLYMLLGVQLKKTMESRAYAYAISADKKAASSADRDAFAYYYLQYQALKRQSPKASPEFTSTCVDYLFNAFLGEEKDAVEKEKKKDAMVGAFTALDQRLQDNTQLVRKERSAVEETQDQLLFLIQNLNLSDPDNDNIIRIALINRYLLMALEASENLDADQKYKLQQQAIETLANVLKKMETDEASHKKEEEKAVAQSSARLMQLLKPAKEKAAAALQQRAIKRLSDAKAEIQKEINLREELKKAKPPRLGRSVVSVEYDLDKGNNPRLAVTVLRWLYEAVSFTSLWVSIIAPLMTLGGASGALQSFLVLLGVGGAVGATASIAGGVVLGVIALVRFSIKMGKEIFSHRKEFNDISNHPDYSNAKKAGLITVVVLKCLGLALLKTLLTDFLVAKIANAFAFGPIARLRNAFRVYPTEDQIEEELAALNDVDKAMSQVNALIAQPEQGDLQMALEKLDKAIGAAEKALTLSINDARKTDTYEQELAEYKAMFEEIKKLQPSFNVMQKMTDAMQNPDEPVPLVPVEPVKKQEANPLPAEQSAWIDLDAYYEKTHPKTLETVQGVDASGYTATLVSGFFRVMDYVGRLFSWQKPEQNVEEQNVLTNEGKKSLDESSHLGESSFILLDIKTEKPKVVVSEEVDALLTSISVIPDVVKAEPLEPKSPTTGWFNFWRKPKPAAPEVGPEATLNKVLDS
ncbi:hypothetical protein [Legionella taurinensis]|uniref:Uncharacterized protein n=1 Tax=Legionella taurinensis TaxID=70611 RepID=A0A3A5L2T2_9GAMM|nr:hypothetical protein [Legionella taurinensis]RJT45865.1 hypothetical protein D6J04_09705 [Legionella taurinensis]RJT66362.1 hypothetical protein D6J03_10345 [Legionella taurinensis]STY27334.1 Uncharacterised protein [Legionella taurinensis]